ncbi:MAG TPA: glycosyltransferase family A protein [Longimicrobiaceae bacterium]|nr:glycosyltransferase family A protein [Longimicrobiaceae bacterium]
MSIIIPVYNTAAFVADALDSVLAQTFSDYEVLVVNDGSPDTELLERELEPYSERIRYLRQENAGVSTARNNALAVARGRYVAMLDSDDRWHPEYLASQVAVLDADPSVHVVYPDALRFGGGPEQRYSEQYPVGGEITFGRVLARERQVYGGVTARMDAVVAAGMYDPELRMAEDFELWLRILHRGGRIVYNDRVLAYYRYRPGSHTSSHRPMLENLARVLDKVGRTMELEPGEREVLERQRAWVHSKLALQDGKDAFRAGDIRTAVQKLREARALSTRRNLKVSLVLALLRIVPGPLRGLYLLRERLHAARSQRAATG